MEGGGGIIKSEKMLRISRRRYKVKNGRQKVSMVKKMKDKIITVSIIGVGARGGEAYGRYIAKLKDKFKIVSLCDASEERLVKYGEDFGVPESERFADENAFFGKKRSDLLLISTLDKMHVRMAKRALALGYDILLEKPISADPDEIASLVECAKKSGRTVMVCHVLRYTAAIGKLKEVLDSGAIGKLVSIDETENVVFWHEAHSFVRGNWRRSEDTSPMIMAKCCHDLDLLQYFAGSRCESVSSMGSLAYFKKENMPAGAAERCTDCKFMETCPYSAKKIYIDMWKKPFGQPENAWPMNVITDELPLTEDNLRKAIETGAYGRCVFACDNDVVDNQTTIMQFENGITATLKMEAFVKDGGRDIRFFGTDGELELRESENKIVLKKYFGENTEWKISELTDDLEGHGGGDHRMIDKLYEVLSGGNAQADTSIENSAESHYMAIAAEASRVAGGKVVSVKEFRKV